MNMITNPETWEDMLLDTLPEIMLTLNLDLQIQWTNKATSNYLGIKQAELQGYYCYHVWCGRPSPCEDCLCLKTLETQCEQEIEVNTLDGRFWNIRCYPLYSSEDHLVGVARVASDITKRKQVEQSLRESDERFHLAMEATHDGIWDWNAYTDEVYYSPNYAAMLGYSIEEVMPHISFWKKHLHPKDKDVVIQKNNDCIENRIDSFELESRMLTKKGEVIWILGRGKAVERDVHGRATRMIGTHVDITHRKKMERELHLQNIELTEQKNLYRSLVEDHHHFVERFLPDTTILFANTALAESLGLTAKELQGQRWIEFLPDSERKKALDQLSMVSPEHPTIINENSFVDFNGQQRWHIWTNHAFFNENNEIKFFQAVGAEITDRKKMEEQLKELSIRDSLTGLYSRNFFEEEIKRLSDERYSPVGIVICDLDGLKFINDTLGHHSGDHLLKNVANILRENFRDSDIIARIGGDEFAILLTQIDWPIIDHMMHRLRQAIKNYNSQSPDVPLSLSIGSAIAEKMDPDIYALFREADNKMYREKIQQEGSVRSAILQALTVSMEVRDFSTQGHSDRLHKLSILVARALGVTQEFENDLTLLARFHDLGKVGIPDHILYKQDGLTEEEWRQMKQHCEIGHRIASSVPDLEPIADLILKHHERWDGQGYPLGISGQDIPLACRILAVVDAFDAMVSGRPYQGAMSREWAIAELRRCAGTQFDPDLVEQFIQIHDLNDIE